MTRAIILRSVRSELIVFLLRRARYQLIVSPLSPFGTSLHHEASHTIMKNPDGGDLLLRATLFLPLCSVRKAVE